MIKGCALPTPGSVSKKYSASVIVLFNVDEKLAI
jgi:hypothetical protein